MKRFLYLLIFCASFSNPLFCMEHAGGSQSLINTDLIDTQMSVEDLEKKLDCKVRKIRRYACFPCMAISAAGGAGVGVGIAAGVAPFYPGIFGCLACGYGTMGAGLGSAFGYKALVRLSKAYYSSPDDETLKRSVEPDVWWCTQHRKPIQTADVIVRYRQLKAWNESVTSYETPDIHQSIFTVRANSSGCPNCTCSNCTQIKQCESTTRLNGALCKDDDGVSQEDLTDTTCKKLLELVAKEYLMYRLKIPTPPLALEMSAIEEE